MKNQSSLSILFFIGFIEFFERFGFYTLQGILVVYLLKEKHFTSTDAFHIYGAFSALLYGFVGLGGWCGERILGASTTLLLGLLVMLLGYLGLTFASVEAFFPSLAGVCIGNALFKANPATILGKIYHDQPEKLHSAFTIFYMTVNLGALSALIIGPFLSHHLGYRYAFFASALGIFIACCVVMINKIKLREVTQELQMFQGKKWHFLGVMGVVILLWVLTVFLLSSYVYVILGLKVVIAMVLAVYLWAAQNESPGVRRRLWVVLILMVEAVVFFTLYHQMPTSINLYGVLHVYPKILGIAFDPQSFQALNPFWIIVWSPVLAVWYQKNAISAYPLSIFHKFSIGMLCCGLSYIVLYVSHFFADASFHVSPMWLVVSYIFQSLAELLVSALGLAMVAELVPTTWMGGVMGMWFLTSSVSGFTGAKVASLIEVPQAMQASLHSLNAFATVFAEIALVIIAISLLMFFSIKYMQKMISLND